MSIGTGVLAIKHWFLRMVWLYSYDADEYSRVKLPTGEVFYALYCSRHWEREYFYNGKSGTLEQMRKYVTDTVYYEMYYWGK